VKIAVVKIRGSIRSHPGQRHTQRLLRLTRTNHCVLVDDRKQYKGMLHEAKDYVTWGEIDAATLESMLRKRGKATDDAAKKAGFKDLKDFVNAFMEGKAELRSLGVKPVFRLKPPSKGLRSTKRVFSMGGDLGYRGAAINGLLKRMI
jgi:large subunit ribosomal protein L30